MEGGDAYERNGSLDTASCSVNGDDIRPEHEKMTAQGKDTVIFRK